MNVRKLRKLQKWILAEPLRFDMDNWRDTALATLRKPLCGTVGCLAGMTCHMEGLQLKDHPKQFVIPAEARIILDLSESEADRLFYLAKHVGLSTQDRWPNKFEASYIKAKTPREKVYVAVRRIDHFIATEGRE